MAQPAAAKMVGSMFGTPKCQYFLPTLLAVMAGMASCLTQRPPEDDQLGRFPTGKVSDPTRAVVTFFLKGPGLHGGEGVIIHPDGYVVTANHFLEKARLPELTVLLTDKRQLEATIVGQDEKTDLAVLKISSSGLPYLPWDDFSTTKLGDPVLIVSPHAPLLFGETYGPIRFATVREVGAYNLVGKPVEYEDFIIVEGNFKNPGFSGALVNNEGQLIGINAYTNSQTDGVGYSISADLGKEITKRLINSGKVVRAWVGVALQELTPGLATAFNTTVQHGIVVSDVNEHGAAYEVGIQRGDVIVEVDGKPIRNVSMWRNMVSLKEIGSEIQMKVIRKGQPWTVYLHLKERPIQYDR
jgi:serine protease Do